MQQSCKRYKDTVWARVQKKNLGAAQLQNKEKKEEEEKAFPQKTLSLSAI